MELQAGRALMLCDCVGLVLPSSCMPDRSDLELVDLSAYICVIRAACRFVGSQWHIIQPVLSSKGWSPGRSVGGTTCMQAAQLVCSILLSEHHELYMQL